MKADPPSPLPPPPVAALGAFVRAHDPDRFLTSLFAPADRRPVLWTLYAFNHELARAREVTREPTLALIRLQWWREVVEDGARRRHEVAGPVGDAIDAGLLDPALLAAAIAGREMEAAPPETAPFDTVDEWRDYLLRAHGGVGAAAAAALGADLAGQDTARHAAAVYGGAGVLRSAPADAARGRPRLPPGIQFPADLAAVVRALDRPGPLPRRALAAALPVVLGRRDLHRLGAPPGPRLLGDRLAVALAALRGHV